jgi:lysine-N-methylase
MTTRLALAARYMTRFSCLGGDCEDTCCGAGWTVPVDEPTHRHLRVLAERDPRVQHWLSTGVQRTPEGPDFARLVFGDDGTCSMLRPSGLCSLHAELGPDALSEVCATYPRYFNLVDDSLELFGTISCPEVARQCLLHDDALELEPLTLEQPPRKLRNHLNTQPPYYRPYRALREALSGLLGTPSLPLADKLFALLWFTQQLSSIVFEGCQAIPEAELNAALRQLRQPEVLAALSANYRALSVSGSFALPVVQRALEGDTHADARHAELDWDRYCALRARVPEPALARVDACLTRYAVNQLLTTPYMLEKTPFAHARDLVVRVAALRYLLVLQLAGFSGSSVELDERIVDVSYRFARRLEHSGLFEKLGRELESQQLGSLAHSVGFISL